MAEAIRFFLNAAFALALAALAASAAAYLLKRKAPQKAVPFLLAACWLALSAGLGTLWAKLGRPPLSNQYESLLTMLWFIFPLSFYFYRRFPVPEALWPAAFTSPVIFGVAGLLDRTARPLMPALRSDWLILHVLSCMAAYAAFALAAVAAAAALAKKRAAEDDDLLLRLVKAGFAFLTLGIVSGSVWANTAWGAWWSWDPRKPGRSLPGWPTRRPCICAKRAGAAANSRYC